ncbi:hypothetical protein RP20_CCG015745 [Aedes albopictus]|nr:uncharacterized protein LOC109425679 isoform X1 [Aedes albopictus]KXJ73472.1 hypothetical protein RP20_CCG015745 [Aedes albopictus]
MRKTGSLAAVILLITVGLAGKVFAFSQGKARGEVSAAQRYFDAVAPEDREAFLKYYLDKALEERDPTYSSITPADFSFIIYEDSNSASSTSRNSPAAEESPVAPNVVEVALNVNGPDNCVKYSLVCYSSGCIDPTNIANICCPF